MCGVVIKDSFQQQNTNSAGRGCGCGGRGRGGQNWQANTTGTSSPNDNNQGYQGCGGQGRGRGVNNSGRGQGGRGNNNSNNSSWPKNKDGRVIGPSTKIQENMGFDYKEYVKLTPDQKQQLYSIRSQLRNDNQSNNSTNTSQNSQNNSSRSSNNNAASQQQINQGDRKAHVRTTMANAAVQEQASSEMEMFPNGWTLVLQSQHVENWQDACRIRPFRTCKRCFGWWWSQWRSSRIWHDRFRDDFWSHWYHWHQVMYKAECPYRHWCILHRNNNRSHHWCLSPVCPVQGQKVHSLCKSATSHG